MPPENLRFGGGVEQTVLHPLVAVLVVFAGILILILPRNKIVVPFIVASILIPMDQVLLVGSLHFPMLRLLILFAVIRVVWLKEFTGSRLFTHGITALDALVMSLTLCSAFAGVMLWQDSKAAIYQAGEIYNVFGIYWFMRFAIQDDEDIARVFRTFAITVAIVGAVMLYERVIGRNPYALLGGARASVYAVVVERDERIRAMGPFGHPILAGTFAGVIIPMFAALWLKGGNDRRTAAVGFAGATVMAITSNSSTPLLAYAGGIAALCCWSFRRLTRLTRWAIVATLIGLHLVMKAPVWHLVARIDLVGGSSGYHRYQLIDQFIRHFRDWWLFGVKNNGDWGWDLWDTANQYVEIGQKSGLVPFLLFLTIIVFGFKYVGRARKLSGTPLKQQQLLWCLGSALFAHVVAFFGISYFDQTIVQWYALLAMIPAAMAIRPAKDLTLPLRNKHEFGFEDSVPAEIAAVEPSLSRRLLEGPLRSMTR